MGGFRRIKISILLLAFSVFALVGMLLGLNMVAENASAYAIPLTVKIYDYECYYGEFVNDPDDYRDYLVYNITAGVLAEGDTLADLNIEITKSGIERDGYTYYCDVGEYMLTATYDNNKYAINFEEGTFAILQKPINITINNATSVYGNSLAEMTFSVDETQLEYGDGVEELSIALDKETGNDVGRYAITGRMGNKNYKPTFSNAVYTITPRPITLAISDKSSVFGDSFKKLTFTVESGRYAYNDTAESLKVNLLKENGRDVGQYIITGESQAQNYAITFIDGKYIIQQRAVEVVFTDYENLVEDGEIKGVKAFLNNAVGTDNAGLKISYNRPPVESGEYKATAMISDRNYFLIGTAEQIFTILKGKLMAEGERISITIADGASLDTTFTVTEGKDLESAERKLSGDFSLQKAKAVYRFSLSEETTGKTVVTVLPDKSMKGKNYKVFALYENDTSNVVDVIENEDGSISFEVKDFSASYVVFTDKSSTALIVMMILFIIVIIGELIVLFGLVRKNNQREKYRHFGSNNGMFAIAAIVAGANITLCFLGLIAEMITAIVLGLFIFKEIKRSKKYN